MDPTQCYLEMYEAMRAGDLITARERALALRNWLSRGGFSPPNYSADEVRAYVANVLRRTAGIAESEDESP
jgi:hypothetical protein